MTLTEEQREAIRVISKLPMAIGCQLCHPYIMKNYGSHFIVLRAMIDSSGTVEPTGGFDLEKARAAVHILENFAFASGKTTTGQIQDILWGARLLAGASTEIEQLQDRLDQNRSDFVYMKEELERLQAIIDKPLEERVWKIDLDTLNTSPDDAEFNMARRWHAAYRKAQNSNLLRKQENELLLAALVEHEEHENQTHKVLGNILGTDDTLENVAKRAAARIKELESSLDEAETLTKKNAETMNGYLARITELEDALVEGLTNFLHYRASCYDPARRCPYAKECDDCSTWDACGHVEKFRSEARQQLQAEGKIGPDAKPQSWQITEERKAAIWHAVAVLKENDPDDEHLWDEEIAVLRAMLTEAE